MLLSMRRRLEKVRETSAQMDIAELRQALGDASKQAADQESFFEVIADENESLQRVYTVASVSMTRSRYADIPQVVRVPRTASRSFTPHGMPCNGPR